MIYDTNNEKDVVLALAYVSFPLTEIIDRDNAEITFNWTWYKSVGLGISSETQEYRHIISYTKGGYEQTPANLSTKATENLN